MKQKILQIKKTKSSRRQTKKVGPTSVRTKIKVDPPAMHEGQLVDWTPTYQTEGSACADLMANIAPDMTGQRQMTLNPRQSAVIDLGFDINLSPGWKLILQASDYLETKGLVISQNVIFGERRASFRVRNLGRETVLIKHGDKVGLMHVEPIYKMEFKF